MEGSYLNFVTILHIVKSLIFGKLVSLCFHIKGNRQ